MEELAEWMEIFDKLSVNYLGADYALLDDLQKLMAKRLEPYPKDAIELIWILMDYDKVQIVERSNFETVMKPWSAFTAVDINNDNELATPEMEKLFWMVEGHRPLVSRL